MNDVHDEAPPMPTPAAAPAGRPVPLTAATALVVLIALSAIGGVVGARHGDGAAPPAAAMLAPEGTLDLDGVPEATAVEFRYAADHADHFREFRCWCGCERAFGHRSLADCFVRPDGRWEAHGAGCGICLAEARLAREALVAGTAPDRIAAALDARFGPDPLPLGEATKDT